MAQTIRNATLEHRTNRLKLAKGKRHWISGGRKGLFLGYRRTNNGFGVWLGRLIYLGKSYQFRLGEADDYHAVDEGFLSKEGNRALTYRQAMDKLGEEAANKIAEVTSEAATPAQARKKAREEDQEKLDVRLAAEHYMSWFRTHRKGIKNTERAIKAHILPFLGDILVADLDAFQIQEWRDRLATTPARKRTKKGTKQQAYRPAPKTEDEKRARQNSVNRTLTILKAILNHAFKVTELAEDDREWRKVKPFEKVDEDAVRFLTEAECARLLNASPHDLRKLCKAALMTGARQAELGRLTARNVNLDTGHVFISSEAKSGKSRKIPLNEAGRDFFRAASAGKTGEHLLFTKDDGKPWKHNGERRLLQEASKHANIEPAVTFHNFRHTYGSLLAQAGVELLPLSKLLGHSDTRITAKHYGHLIDKTLSDAAAKLPSFGHVLDKKIRPIHG